MKSIRFKFDKLDSGMRVVFTDPNDVDDVMDLILTITRTGEIYKVRTFIEEYIFVPEYYIGLWKEQISPYIFTDKDDKLYFLVSDNFKFVRARKE